MSDLLAQATTVLAGGRSVTVESRRGACWLARAALEDAVRDLLLAAGHDPGNSSMRAQLACLESAYPLDAPGSPTLAARHAWIGLSAAAHHHAFQLAPTVAEVEHLLRLVAWVTAPNDR